ncbi:hypothetical protein AAC387_Pa01g1031 [Persea americana]
MEPQHYQQQQHHHQQQQQQQHISEDSSSSTSSKSSFLCRQSTTRWIPTTDQIRILKDLYYNNGVRSPSGEQIQRISARLRQYGKIEGKNVFYWFQNHKARERQKKKFTADVATMQRGWKPEDPIPNKYTNMGFSHSSSSTSPSPSPGVLAVGQMGSIGCFRECSIQRGGYGGNNVAWVGMETCSPPYSRFETRRPIEPFDTAAAATNVETLPLFPMRGDEHSSRNNDDTAKPEYFSGWYFEEDEEKKTKMGSTSLELSLDSYSAGAPDVTWPRP